MYVALRPFYKREALLSPAEQHFYEVLKEAVSDYIVLAKNVFAKVRLADLVEADKRHLKHESNFEEIATRHVDFVICDDRSSLIIAIELDDSSHEQPKTVARDRDVNRICELASLPLLRVPFQQTYHPREIAEKILATLKAS